MKTRELGRSVVNNDNKSLNVQFLYFILINLNLIGDGWILYIILEGY